MQFSYQFLYILIIIYNIRRISTYVFRVNESLSYVGAVVEFQPITQELNTNDYIDLNIAKHLEFINVAAKENVDILVFPESSMSLASGRTGGFNEKFLSYIPNPEHGVIPCNDPMYARTIRNISCASRDHQIYVVLNHHERVDLSGRNGKFLTYNTNVVFDRKGRVIARYRKYNLFHEPGINVTLEPELSTFKTDFGVTFGQFICFDILFKTPALDLVRNSKVTDFVYSAHWFSSYPFLYNTEIQSAWAFANNINLLASAYNNPKTLSGGSGIYIGQDGPNNVFMSAKRFSNVLIVSEIPKIIDGKRRKDIDPKNMNIYQIDSLEPQNPDEQEAVILYADGLQSYTTVPIDLNEELHNVDICNRGLCCNFQVNNSRKSSINNQDFFRYRFAVLNGTRVYGKMRMAGVMVCGIVTCEGDSLQDCRTLDHGEKKHFKMIKFKYISITMSFKEDTEILSMPVTLDKNFTTFNLSNYSYIIKREMDEVITINMELKEPTDSLATFAIYNRNYRFDKIISV